MILSYDEIRTELMEELSKAFAPMEFTSDVRQTPVREPLPNIHNTNVVKRKKTNR